jgi:prepilin-type N-terminal cleavage/methylation domain-containing protein
MLRKGFTLLEVLIVVIIIGILAAIALPQYTTTIEKSRSGEAATNIGALRTSIDRFWYQNGSFPASIDDLDIDSPNLITNRLFDYTIADGGTSAETRNYTVKAERIGKEGDYWVQWTQTDNNTGKLTRSAKLGGPTS